MTEELVMHFLRERKELLNIKGIADAAGLPARTLLDYIAGTRGRRGIPEDTVSALANVIEGLRAPWAPRG